MRAMKDEELARYRALNRICHIDRHGTIEGVEIDFRHELLNPSEWQMLLIGTPVSLYRSKYEPFIWYPWFGDFDKDALRAEIVADELKHGRKEPSKKSVDASIRDLTPECFVYAGDRIDIDKVERIGIGDFFDHPHDAEVRLARLRIVRAKGKSEKIKTPLMFTGVTSLTARTSGNDFFYKIVHRICKKFGLQSLSEINLESKEKTYAYGALSRAHLIEWRTEEIRKLADDFVFHSRKHHDAFTTWSLVNESVLLGYFWAKAEAEMGLKPLAESALRLKAGGSLGGNKSGESRRNKRAHTWEPRARELAKSIRAQHSSFSQDRVASEIEAQWKETNFDPPGHKTLKDLVSGMEKDGELPARKTR
jgi:hypothetical protein